MLIMSVKRIKMCIFSERYVYDILIDFEWILI